MCQRQKVIRVNHKKIAEALHQGSRRAKKLGMADCQRHLLLCYDKKEAKCASKGDMADAWDYLRRRLRDLKLYGRGGLLMTKSQCFDICKGGPIAVVYPEGTWYGRCTPEVLEQILQRHLLRGQIVQEYVLAQPPLCLAGAALQWRGAPLDEQDDADPDDDETDHEEQGCNGEGADGACQKPRNAQEPAEPRDENA